MILVPRSPQIVLVVGQEKQKMVSKLEIVRLILCISFHGPFLGGGAKFVA
jgi:hypothetical protein